MTVLCLVYFINNGGGIPGNLIELIRVLQEELVSVGILSSDYGFKGH